MTDHEHEAPAGRSAVGAEHDRSDARPAAGGDRGAGPVWGDGARHRRRPGAPDPVATGLPVGTVTNPVPTGSTTCGHPVDGHDDTDRGVPPRPDEVALLLLARHAFVLDDGRQGWVCNCGVRVADSGVGLGCETASAAAASLMREHIARCS